MRRGTTLAAVLVTAVLLAACDRQEAAPPAAVAPPAVTVVPVVKKEVTSTTDFVGRVVAVDKVELRARVTGFIEQRAFDEGQDVKVGNLLFVIEQEPFKARISQAEADLASAEATAKNSGLQLARAETLVKRQNIPQSTVDDRAAEDAIARSRVQQAQAALELAKIDLSYTEIQAPVAGRIGLAKYSVGNLVGPNSDVLAVIVSQDPVYVTFPVSQRQIIETQRRMAAQGGDPGTIVVRLRLADGSDYPQPGKVDFLDVQVDQGTDTVTVRAEFPNPQRMLVDGQFANVSVAAEKPAPSLVIPQVALQVDQAGPFVLVVDKEQKIEIRRVTIGTGTGSEIPALTGLAEGDLVVTEGILKVRPGQIVEATAVPAAPEG